MLVVVGLVRLICAALEAVQLLEEPAGSRTLSQIHIYFGGLLLGDGALSAPSRRL
jgi:hypothetical protein